MSTLRAASRVPILMLTARVEEEVRGRFAHVMELEVGNL